MSDSANGIFEKIVEAATERVADKGFDRATQKDITLACFGLLSRQIKCRVLGITKPMGWMVTTIGAGMIYLIISHIFEA